MNTPMSPPTQQPSSKPIVEIQPRIRPALALPSVRSSRRAPLATITAKGPISGKTKKLNNPSTRARVPLPRLRRRRGEPSSDPPAPSKSKVPPPEVVVGVVVAGPGGGGGGGGVPGVATVGGIC